ncbi:MAG: DUF533 domain-containing protein [Vicinamibacterales bacterium]
MNLDLLGGIVGPVLGGLLGGRRKRSRNALRFLTRGRGGRGPLTNAGTLVTVAGIAWGIFDTLSQGGTSDGAPGTSGVAAEGRVRAGVMSPPGPVPSQAPPPIPGTSAASPSVGAVGDDVIRMVRLAVSAAHADGTVGDTERAALAQAAKAAGGNDLLLRELGPPRPLAEIVAGVADRAEKATLYVLAFTILRADEQVSGAERIYLAQLANLLGLGPQVVQALERDTAGRIDAFGHQG